MDKVLTFEKWCEAPGGWSWIDEPATALEVLANIRTVSRYQEYLATKARVMLRRDLRMLRRENA